MAGSFYFCRPNWQSIERRSHRLSFLRLEPCFWLYETKRHWSVYFLIVVSYYRFISHFQHSALGITRVPFSPHSQFLDSLWLVSRDCKSLPIRPVFYGIASSYSPPETSCSSNFFSRRQYGDQWYRKCPSHYGLIDSLRHERQNSNSGGKRN